MGIVRQSEYLERYFKATLIEWRLLSDKEYRTIVMSWKSAFEENLKGSITLNGNRGIAALESHLPEICFIFNCPNYPHLQNNIGADRQLTYCYEAKLSAGNNLQSLNGIGAIVCDQNFTFMCAFDHEFSGFSETYCSA